jgi:DNA-binding transcriptional ArsR family regulator
MNRNDQRYQAEQLALSLLARSESWTCPTELAAAHNESWRTLARALRRLEGKGIISGRQIEVPREKGRKSVRREYRLQVNNPLLVLMPKFDPSQLNIVGVRVVRFD